MCGEPLVVFDSGRSRDKCRQVDVDDAVPGQLIVQLMTCSDATIACTFGVVHVTNHARPWAVFLLASTLDTAVTRHKYASLKCLQPPNTVLLHLSGNNELMTPDVMVYTAYYSCYLYTTEC